MIYWKRYFYLFYLHVLNKCLEFYVFEFIVFLLFCMYFLNNLKYLIHFKYFLIRFGCLLKSFDICRMLQDIIEIQHKTYVILC